MAIQGDNGFLSFQINDRKQSKRYQTFTTLLTIPLVPEVTKKGGGEGRPSLLLHRKKE